MAMARRFVRRSDSSARRQLLEELRGDPNFAATHLPRNAYGLVVIETYNTDYPSLTLETLPVICGHGGSMWLCAECAEKCLGKEST